MSADTAACPKRGRAAKGLLLFDFDGVLVESLAVYERVVKRALERIGSPLVESREDFLDLFDGTSTSPWRGRALTSRSSPGPSG